MTDTTIAWLSASDPAIHWQVLRDLLDAHAPVWQAERARVETEGWGARLLACQGDDGLWAGGAFVPHAFDWSTIKTVGQPWTATCWSLAQLREFGLDPASESARRTVQLVRENGRWDHDGQPYWDGEVEECINGRTVATGTYFGVNVSPIVARLLSEQQPDGGWNCERCSGSVRSSFHTTINVLEGLLEFERAMGGRADVAAARRTGEEYLLSRALLRRQTNGELVDPQFLLFLHPHVWRYDVLRALEYFRESAQWTGAPPDARLREAIDIVRARQRADGTWPLDWRTKGTMWFTMDDGPGSASAWITLKALRVLRWWDAAIPSSEG
jgi:Prenyltransferase and squalene oxidase repeat